jgi:hypothetical protein
MNLDKDTIQSSFFKFSLENFEIFPTQIPEDPAFSTGGAHFFWIKQPVTKNK